MGVYAPFYLGNIDPLSTSTVVDCNEESDTNLIVRTFHEMQLCNEEDIGATEPVQANDDGWDGHGDTDDGDTWGSPGPAIDDFQWDSLGEDRVEDQETSGRIVERTQGEIVQDACWWLSRATMTNGWSD